MSDITLDFVKATKRILEKVATILTHIERVEGDVKSIRERIVDKGDAPAPDSQSSNPELDGLKALPATKPTKAKMDKEQRRDESEGFFQRQFSRWKRQIQKPRFQVGVLTLVFLIFYTCETKRTNDLTERAMNLDQRAWVGIVFPITMVDATKIEANVPFKFKIRFKNSGKTPALKISYDPVIILQPTRAAYPDYDARKKDSKPFMEQMGIKESAVLSPGEETFVTFPMQPENGQKVFFNKDAVDSIEDYRMALFIVGMVTYRDIFTGTPEHHTKFCLIYSPKDGEVGACPVNRGMD